jgi:DNA helicase II / ATP-dependent DNA helicase PcrA
MYAYPMEELPKVPVFCRDDPSSQRTDMRLPSGLNKTQESAVIHNGGPLCILAGAGSGKTRVVIHRIAHLIEEEYQPPWSILAVTFTNKAAEEMRTRIDQLVPGAGADVQVGTFHSMAARTLRRYGSFVGVPSSFVIYDQDDAKRMMRRIVDRNGWSRDLIRAILHRIDLWQCEGLSPDQVPDAAWDPLEEKAKTAYAMYRQELEDMEAVDFGGLLVKWRDLLNHENAIDIKRRIRHLLVDEYQDTNGVQSEIVRAFTATTKSITVVGDDDQAIYGWRGARADNLREFVQKTDHASLIRLEENYRSTEHILTAANGIISHNRARLGKILKPVRGLGRRVRLVRCRDDLNESRTVVRMIQDHLHEGGSLKEIAILYRTNAHSRLFEDELRKADLAYRLIGGFRFYDRKEIKDVLATLRCALNPKSTIDTLRMLTAVPRGIGAKSLEKLQKIAAENHIALLEVLRDDGLMAADKIGPRIRRAAVELAEQIFSLRKNILPQSHPDAGPPENCVDAKEAVAEAIRVSKIAEQFQKDSTPEAEGRLENLEALISAAAQYVQDSQMQDIESSVIGFLEAASLLEAEEKDRNNLKPKGPQLTLMTLHAAKGLEFKVVFLVGWEEHGFPHSRALEQVEEDREQLEEERRLAYVGITRAQEKLVITWAGRRMVQGTIRNRHPSRFLREMPASVIEGDRPFARVEKQGLATQFREETQRDEDIDLDPIIEYDPEFVPQVAKQKAPKTKLLQFEKQLQDGVGRFREQTISKVRQRHGRDETPSATLPTGDEQHDGASSDLGGLARGMLVNHSRYGTGTVVGFRGAGQRLCALVRFGKDQTPRVIVCRFLSPASPLKETDEPA